MKKSTDLQGYSGYNYSLYDTKTPPEFSIVKVRNKVILFRSQ